MLASAILSWLAVAKQVLILLAIAAGNAFWLWRSLGKSRSEGPRDWLWLLLAGACIHPLLLQSLVYLGVPVRLSAWPAFLVSAMGIVLALRTEGLRRGWSREAIMYCFVFAAGFIGQAPGLLAHGPARYYGSAHVDHANYVVTAEFLRSERFDTTVEELGYRPWMLKALQTKEQRITQCVALAGLAEIDRSSAQETYGTLSLFLLALTGVATAAWLRSAGLSLGAAGGAGLAAVLTPALTRIQLDGFFSQTATLFIFPALAGLMFEAGSSSRITKTCAAIFLGFMVGSYTEVAVFGYALVGALLAIQRLPLRQRLFDFAAIVAGSLIVNLGYVGRMIEFAVGQATFASNPNTLGALFPESGTWVGWGRLFVDLPWPGFVAAGGGIVMALGIWSVAVDRRQRRSWTWLVVLGVALVPLLMLRGAPTFHSYPFAKLSAHFTPIWMGAAMAGFAGIAQGLKRGPRVIGVGAFMAVVCGWGTTIPRHAGIVRPSGWLAVMSSESLFRTRREAETSAGRVYLVSHGDPLMAFWLCYFGRHNQTVLERRTLGDRIVPSETYAFRRWSGGTGSLWSLEPDAVTAIKGYEAPPALKVHGSGAEFGSDKATSFLVEGAIDFIFERPATGVAVRNVWLDFVARPVDSTQAHLLTLHNPGQATQQFTMRMPGWQRWRVALPLGETTYRLQIGVPGTGAEATGRLRVEFLSVEVAEELLPGDPTPVSAVQAR